MTQGTYTRCATYRCKKKVIPGSNLCSVHGAGSVFKMKEANPALTRLVEAVVTEKLSKYGLIGER